MASPPHIPYQAYKSKRHSRTVSSPLHFEPNVSPAPQVRPPTLGGPIGPAIAIKANGEEKASTEHHDVFIEEKEPVDDLKELNGSIPQSPTAPIMNVDVSTSSPEPQQTELPDPSPASTPPLSPQASSSKILTVDAPRNGASTTSITGTTPAVAPPKPAAPRKASTFRFVPLRPPMATPRTSSPLRPANTHGRSLSMATPATRQFDHLHAPDLRDRSVSSVPPRAGATPLANPVSNSVIAPTSSMAETAGARPLPASTLFQATSAPPLELFLPPHRTSSLGALAQAASPTPSQATSPARGPAGSSILLAPTITPTPSTSSTVSRATTPTTTSAASPSVSTFKTAYRPGFQPKGVYRPRTDDFIAHRTRMLAVGRVERTRLERRFEKLVNLHFTEDEQRAGEKGKGKAAPPLPPNRRASTLFDFDLNELRAKGAAELFKSVLESRAAVVSSGAGEIRAAEQKITPWQDDATASACPLCSASFHPLTNRKHHCRLCGQIICSLPVKQPQRPVVCSLLFVVNPKTGRIEEVSERVDYGVRPRSDSGTGRGPRAKAENAGAEEKYLKGVRICRECKPVMLRQQYKQEAKRVPTFARLYEALKSLEVDIQEALPHFQELMLSLSQHPDDAPPKEATAARKRLLESFAEYDALSKRIRNLPPLGGAGSSQDRVQQAILTRANLFLQKHMFPLQSLPQPKKRVVAGGNTNGVAVKDTPVIDPDSELAHALQPLLEQEALLESFVEEATAHRKFEDAKTLKANLGEIRSEIDRIIANADGDGSAS